MNSVLSCILLTRYKRIIANYFRVVPPRNAPNVASVLGKSTVSGVIGRVLHRSAIFVADQDFGSADPCMNQK